MSVATIEATVGGAPDTIHYDGSIHRFPIGRSKDAGWYVAHLSNGFPVIVFGNWKDQSRFKIYGDEVVDDAVIERNREQRQPEQQRRTKDANRTATLAASIWKTTLLATHHPYLTRKGIGANGARVLSEQSVKDAPKWFQRWIKEHSVRYALVVPMVRAGQIVDLQFILPETGKRYLPKGDHKAARYILGNPKESDILIVGTGFATCCTIYECTGLPTVVAFDDGNLESVVNTMRNLYPQKTITIAADNDIHTDNKVINSGVVYSTATAKKHDCLLAIPELNQSKVDFNDLFLAKGQQAVIDGIQAAVRVKPHYIEKSADEASRLLELALSDWLDSRDQLGVKAPAGLGKSTRLLQLIKKRKLACDYFVPSYQLAVEQSARLPEGQSIAIRGRRHQTPDNPPLCAKWQSAEFLEKCGLAHKTMPLLCGAIDHKTGQRPCPYSKGCGYLHQFNSTAPIRFYAHEYLPLENSRLTKRPVDIAVIDETFRDSLEKIRSWSLGELYSQDEPIYRKLAMAIIEDRLLSLDGLDEIDQILNEETELESHLHPEMDAGAAANKARPLMELRRKPTGFLWNCKKAIENNWANRLWFNNVDGGKIFAAWTKEIRFIDKDTPTAYLDASLVESIIKKVSPNCRIVAIDATRKAHITQITDTSLSYQRLTDDKDYLSSRLLEFIHRNAKENPNGAVIAPKFWIEAHGERIPDSVKVAHYGALRGLNTLEGCDWLVQIGRYQPPPHAVEATVRAWFPDARLNLTGGYLLEQRQLTAKDGAGAVVWTYTHPDPRCRDVLTAIREQESLQALDRLRLIYGKVKRVVLLCNLPLPGVEPDELATLDGLTLPGRLAEVALRDGVVVTGRKELAGKHPDVFPTEDAALQAVRNINLNVLEPNKTPIRNQHIYPTVNYRVDGQPGKARTVIVPNGNDEGLSGRLEVMHGRPVKLVMTPERQRVKELCDAGMSAWDAWRLVRG